MHEPHQRIIVRLSGDFYRKARKTRLRFLQRLARNLRDALDDTGVSYRMTRTWSRIHVDTDQPEAALEVTPRVFGVQSASLAERVPWESLDDLVRQGGELFRPVVAGRRFAVRCRRLGDRRRIPFDSVRVECELGAALLPASAGVDLGQPEVTAFVEVDDGFAYLFDHRLDGSGGLPVGVQGRAVALVSGGFDSAVASWLMLKRGVALDYLFVNLGGAAHRRGVLEVAKVLADRWSYGSWPRLFEIDLRPLVGELRRRVDPSYWQIVLKRLMVSAGERMAERLRAQALITGDAIGQVSSQTLSNLAVVSRATVLPVLSPLLGYNKEEILVRARAIGVYEAASAVEEYCALEPPQAETRAKSVRVETEEAKLDRALVEETLARRHVFPLRSIDPGREAPDELGVETLPEGATILDLRSREEHLAWHPPGALRLDFDRALEAYRSFEEGRTYVVYCEVGLKSAHLAELMREAGLDAHYFRGGSAALRTEVERQSVAV